MQDEHFMQSWNDGHRRFSADLDHGLGHLARKFERRGTRAKDIRNPYGIPADVEGRPALSPAASASLRGLAASLITGALWLVVMALATPTPGLAASSWASTETCACIAHPPLA